MKQLPASVFIIYGGLFALGFLVSPWFIVVAIVLCMVANS